MADGLLAFAPLRHGMLLAEVDGVFEGEVPVVGGPLDDTPQPTTFGELTRPLRALGLELRRPPPEAPTGDRCLRIACELLRLAYDAARESVPTDQPGWHGSAQNQMEWRVIEARACSASDREKLRAAIRAVAEPLLEPEPRVAGPGLNPTEGACAPGTRPSAAPRKTKGANVNARMLDAVVKDASRLAWSAREWADHLGCAPSTVVATLAWKEKVRPTQVTLKVERVQNARSRNAGSPRRRKK